MTDGTDEPGPASEDGEGSSASSIAGTELAAYVGLGGALACCAVIELLGGAVILGGLAAFLGLSTTVTYLGVGAAGGSIAALSVLGYRRVRGTSSD